MPGIERVNVVQARWIGHRLHADVAISVSDGATAKDVLNVTEALKEDLFGHLPALAEANVRLQSPSGPTAQGSKTSHAHNHHAPAPFKVASDLADGKLSWIPLTANVCASRSGAADPGREGTRAGAAVRDGRAGNHHH